jgi:hypothetical protein
MSDDGIRAELDLLRLEVATLTEAIAEIKGMMRARAMGQRRALLSQVHELEREWKICPTTAELRKLAKAPE